MLFEPAFAHLITTKVSVAGGMPVIASPVHGLDTSLSATMFIDTGAVTPAAAGQSVAAVNDAFGGTTRNLQQATVANRPQLIANLAGTRPGLRFNGTSQWLQLFPTPNSGVPFQGRSFTFCVVYRRDPNTGGGFEDTLFFAGNAEGGTDAHWFDNVIAYLEPSGLPVVGRATGTETTYVGLANGAYQSGALTKLVCRASQTNGIEIRSRSAAGAFSGTGTMGPAADLYPWNTMAVGAGPTWEGVTFPSYYYTGDLFEMRFWASRAADAEFDGLQAHLDSKWGA